MNPLLRRLLGAYLDEATDGTHGGAGGGTAAPDAGAGEDSAGTTDASGALTDAGKPAAGTTQEPKDVSVEAMAEAIQTGLDEQRARGPDGKFIKEEARPAAQPGDKAAAVTPGAPPAKAAPDAAAAADAEAIKGKTADDFQLTPELERVLKADAKQRFHGLTAVCKAREAEIAELRPQMEQLREARDNIMEIMEESQTGPQELGQLLEFNKLIKTQQFARALEMVEAYRAQLYKIIGKEAPGVDLVSEFADLNARVDAGEISREDAVALANSRRREAQLRDQGSQQRHQQDQSAAVERARTDGLNAVNAWITKTAKEDPHFAAREAIVAGQTAEVIKEYPPHLWATTLAKIYRNTAVPAARQTTQIPSSDGVLRPNGTRTGPAAPTDMSQAIAQQLGYQI